MCTLTYEHVPPNGNIRGYVYPQTEIWVDMLIIFLQFNSYVKACLNIWWRRMYGLKLFLFTSCQRVYWCVCDDWQVCVVRVNSLIKHLQLKNVGNLPVCTCCIITFQLLEMSSITTLNQTISNIHTRYIFQRYFYTKNIGDFTDLHNEKNQIWKFRVNGIVSVIGTRVNFYQISQTWQP